jgi:hypothetical protein
MLTSKCFKTCIPDFSLTLNNFILTHLVKKNKTKLSSIKYVDILMNGNHLGATDKYLSWKRLIHY